MAPLHHLFLLLPRTRFFAHSFVNSELNSRKQIDRSKRYDARQSRSYVSLKYLPDIFSKIYISPYLLSIIISLGKRESNIRDFNFYDIYLSFVQRDNYLIITIYLILDKLSL